MYKSLMRWVLITVALVALAGCSSTGTREDGAEASDQSTDMGGAYDGGGSGTSTSAASQGGSWYGDPLEDPNSPLANRIIYFDYDQSTVRMEYLDVVRAHAGEARRSCGRTRLPGVQPGVGREARQCDSQPDAGRRGG